MTIASPNPTERFIHILSRDCQFTATEIADVLWLAQRQYSLPLVKPEVHSSKIVDREHDNLLERNDEDSAEEVDESNIPKKRQPKISFEGQELTSFENFEEDNLSEIQLASTRIGTSENAKILPVNVTTDDSLQANRLSLVNALRPLLKRVISQIAVSQVDEIATTELMAETECLCSPVMQPKEEPWFDVALVIDGSAGMNIWRQLIKEIQRLLHSYASFRDLRVWELVDNTNDNDGGCISVKPANSSIERSPRTLLAPDRRRLILVFSDCTADYWWTGAMQPILRQWGAALPTAIWQVLPNWMWKRTALGIGDFVAIRNKVAGANNQDLQPIPLSLQNWHKCRHYSTSKSICVPVVTTEASALAAWSRVITGDHRQSVPGFLLPADGWQQKNDLRNKFDKVTEKLQEFRHTATPEARQLAILLSASPAITLPIMRLIRGKFCSFSASTLAVAEVFMSGLLQPVSKQHSNIDAEDVKYTFADAARDQLLEVLPTVDAIKVIEGVSEHVAERLKLNITDFRALLTSPDLREEAKQYGLDTFANATAKVLRRLDGRYLELANEFDSQRSSTETQKLELVPRRFEFQTARVEREISFWRGERWNISYGQSNALGYTQTLTYSPDISIMGESLARGTTNVITLDMISIPAGHYMMGSEDAEEERFDDEAQKEVNISAFYLGRTPITQAQWRIVSRFKRIKKVLEANPSTYRGDDKPVEGVSWEDAIEFCERLSAQTGRNYRLPSEQEWEYACRAGTTTRFHFGNTLTTELANYSPSRNNQRLHDIPIRGTTDVRTFPANDWGLYDTHGNVSEWCSNLYETSKPNYHVLRGGAFNQDLRYCRSAWRGRERSDRRFNTIGFRVAVNP